MNFSWLWRNELATLLTQGGSHRGLFARQINGRLPGTPRGVEEREYFDRWRLPELGFRNYWYPVILSKELNRRPILRRLLGEDIVFWRDGGRVHALANRCPHRGASLAAGHIRFPGSGTISCPYHGWTFDGTGQLRACIQEGPDSAMPAKVRTKAYPVEERLGVVWVWIGDMEPVPVEEDLPVAMKVPGVTNFIHFTAVWRTNWAPLFDNFIDSLHPPYLHRSSPQYLFRKLPFRTLGVEPHFEPIEHDDRILEVPHTTKTGQVVADQVEFPGLGTFPRHKWWRVRNRRRPSHSFIPGYQSRSFLHAVPCYVHTVHEDFYFTQYIIPIDADHLYSMCAMTGRFTPAQKLWWRLGYFRWCQLTHDTLFVGQDHRVMRGTKLGRERLSAWDEEVIRYRKFAVQHARGYQPSPAPKPEEEPAAPVEQLATSRR
jgi:phenylpropionate dioxygenase-like ring-hydroxylating dioxygenase large terminal subunit